VVIEKEIRMFTFIILMNILAILFLVGCCLNLVRANRKLVRTVNQLIDAITSQNEQIRKVKERGKR